MRFSKFAQNSPENDVHVKQVSNPSFLGIVGDKKWSPFSDLGVQSPILWHLKTANLSVLGAKKLDFGRPNLKTDTTFCHQLSPKMME